MIFAQKNHFMYGELTKHNRIFVWMSTFISLLCLGCVVKVSVAAALLVSFVAASISVPYTFWVSWKRFMLFGFLVALVVVQISEANRELGTALLMVTMIVKFVELRSRKDISMLLLCNTLAPFVGFLQKENVVVFVVGLVGVLLTLVIGYSVFTIRPKNQSIFRPISSVLLWALLALPVTGLFYVLTPRIDNPLWGGMHNRSKTGVGDEMNVAQWSELFNDLSTAFRVRYEGRIPKPQEMYFRGVTLWTFDGQVWSSTPSRKGAVTPVSSLGGEQDIRFKYHISYVVPTNRIFAMDFPVHAPGKDTLFSDGHIRTASGRYRNGAITLESGPIPHQPLSPEQRASALQLPVGLNPKTVSQAKAWRKNFSSDEQYVQFIMNYFASRYQYSLSPPPLSSPHVVDSFLFETKTGFCAHYSSAFAVLMRAANVPTRVVNGYVGSEMDSLGGYFRIRQADAHAWNEVWLKGQWVRFDPTSQVTTIRSRTDMTWDLMNQTYSVSDWLNEQWSARLLSYDKATQEQFFEYLKDIFLKIPLWGAIVASGFAFFGGWVWLGRKKRYSATDLLAHELDQWFLQFPDIPLYLGWSFKLQKIEHRLTPQDYQRASDIVKQTQEALYGNRSIPLNRLRSQIKKFRVRH